MSTIKIRDNHGTDDFFFLGFDYSIGAFRVSVKGPVFSFACVFIRYLECTDRAFMDIRRVRTQWYRCPRKSCVFLCGRVYWTEIEPFIHGCCEVYHVTVGGVWACCGAPKVRNHSIAANPSPE